MSKIHHILDELAYDSATDDLNTDWDALVKDAELSLHVHIRNAFEKATAGEDPLVVENISKNFYWYLNI